MSDNVEKITATIEVTVDPDWIELCTKHCDIFIHDICGYWMRGMKRQDDLGWLCHEFDSCVVNSSEYSKIVKAWIDEKPLPEGWHRLDKAAAIKAYKVGVEKFGTDWYENGDANTYDTVVQLALLGEQRYA